MKKTMSVFLALSVIFTMLTLSANMTASALTSGDYTYTVDGGNATITEYTGNDSILTIPSMLGGYPVVTIGEGAFSFRNSLTSVTIPDSVTSIGVAAFHSTSGSLADITVSVNNPSYADLDGVLYNKDCTTLIKYPRGKTQTSFAIPYGVSSIESDAFFACTKLTSVTISTSVTNIESHAFEYCTGLTSITIPGSVTNLIFGTFELCTNLKSVTILDGVKSIGSGVFRDCGNLTSIAIPASVTSIGYNAFDDYSSLTIYGRRGSYAQTYADSKAIPFICVGDFVAQTVKGNPGQTVSVTVSIENNPGIIAAKLNVNYDNEKIKLVGVTNGGIFGAEAFEPGNNLSLVPYSILWEDGLAAVNNTSDGTLVTLTFEIDVSTEAGTVPIEITCDQNSTFDIDLNEAEFATVNGAVEITNNIPGDPNKDGSVDLKDVVLIRRWLAGGWDAVINEANADVNGDGVVSSKDLVVLRRYLAGGWDAELVYSDILYV